jgi:hypothetical protein
MRRENDEFLMVFPGKRRGGGFAALMDIVSIRECWW